MSESNKFNNPKLDPEYTNLPKQGKKYIYNSRESAENACQKAGYDGLCTKQQVTESPVGSNYCACGWTKDTVGYNMLTKVEGCSSSHAGWQTWCNKNGPASAHCCGRSNKLEKDIIEDKINEINKLFFDKDIKDAYSIGKLYMQNLTNVYTNNLKLHDSNIYTMADQDKILGNNDLKHAENQNKIDEINHSINRETRQLKYDQEEYKRKNILILMLKISTITLASLLIVFVLYKCFNMYKDSIVAAAKKHL